MDAIPTLTLASLQEITQSTSYRTLPMQAAKARQEEDWWDQVNAITRSASDRDIWEIASAAGVVFDTYPDLIDEIDISFEYQSERGSGEWVECTLKINGENFDRDTNDLDEELSDAMEEIDGMDAVNFLYESMGSALGSRQMGDFDRVQKLFDKTLINAKMARDIALSAQPDLVALLDAQEIERATPTARKTPGKRL